MAPDSRATVLWDRGRRAPIIPTRAPASGREVPTCLWIRGFIANRSELALACGGSTDMTDRELLVATYLRHGTSAPARVAGPLSWVLWDGERGRLMAVADRMGSSRLYYSATRERLVLDWRPEVVADASEGGRRPHEPSLIAHLSGRACPVSRSFYDGVDAIGPGDYLLATAGALETGSYWQPQPGARLRLASDQEYGEALRSLLRRVTDEHSPGRRSAITLSSGLDSASVAASLRAGCDASDLTAIRWIAPSLPQADEDAPSLAVARHLDIEQVAVRADHFWTLSDPAGLGTGAHSPQRNPFAPLWDATFETAVRLGVRHVFTGLSGDHLFGGAVYPYADFLLRGNWLRLGRELRRHLPRSKLTHRQLVRRMIFSPLIRSLPVRAHSAGPPPLPWLETGKRSTYADTLLSSERNRLLSPGRQQRLRLLRDPLLPQLAEATTLHADEHGLEVRNPLIDHRLIDFAARLPPEQTFRSGLRKVILRSAMTGMLPEATLRRPAKVYPTAIANLGLRQKETARAWELLDDMRCADLGLVNPGRLRAEYRSFVQGEHDSSLFWYALTLEDWLRRSF